MTEPKYNPGLQELIDLYNVLLEYLTYKWNRVPSMLRSFIKITIALLAMELWIQDVLTVNSFWKFLLYPSLVCFTFLGCFYIYHEIKTQWQKLNSITTTNADNLSGLK